MSKNTAKLIALSLLCTESNAIREHRTAAETLSPILLLMGICIAFVTFSQRRTIFEFFQRVCSENPRRDSVQPVTPASSLQTNAQREPVQPLLGDREAMTLYHSTILRADRHVALSHHHTGSNA
jgi:hypothetical protein